MESFNEEEIQKKIEEKRKRFIENAHRALGFYDQNIITSTDEHKKKRTELIEKEFNKVFDPAPKQKQRYDEEPAKPKILPINLTDENIQSSPSIEKFAHSFKATSPPFNISKKEKLNEDSLSIAEKEMEL